MSSIFQIDFRGPVADVSFNNSHPYVARLEQQAGADAKLQTLAEFIVGLELARNQSMDEGLMEPATVFELESDRTQRILSHLVGNLE